jgi:protein-disulfide isomerase
MICRRDRRIGSAPTTSWPSSGRSNLNGAASDSPRAGAFMTQGWKQTAAAGAGGAVLGFVMVVLASGLGLLPANGPAIHQYLLSHPDVVVEMLNAVQAEDDAKIEDTKQTAVDKLGSKAFFNPKVAFVTGPATAKSTVVEFFDYNCPYCRASVPAVMKFYAAHKNDTRFAFIEFPFKGPESVIAARAAIAARKQPGKYLAFHFLLMNEDNVTNADMLFADARKAGLDVDKLKADMADSSVDLTIAAARTLADAAKVNATPTFIINGKVREGTINEKTLSEMARRS